MPIHHLDHVGIKVSQLEVAISGYENLGFRLSARRAYDAVGIEVAFLELGAHRCELLRSLSPHSPIAAAPPGLHHTAYACAGLQEEYRRLLGDPAFDVHGPPSPGAHGHPVFFFRVRGEPALLELVGREDP